MDIRNRIQTFIEVGRMLRAFPGPLENGEVHPLAGTASEAEARNPWFTRENIRYALNALGDSMHPESLEIWLDPYMDTLKNKETKGKIIGIVTAGNIPLAGFHDFLSVLVCGYTFCGKLSGQDAVLLPAIARLMVQKSPEWTELIKFTDAPFKEIDAIIATGSDNTYRYFEYYFSRYPHIIRRNRNGVAILTGNENEEDLKGLGADIMLYFGLGCRNVSKIYIPAAYDVLQLVPCFEPWEVLIRHNKYYNNYEYQKSIRLVNRKPFHDFGNIMLVEEPGLASPVSVLNYERYDNLESLKSELRLHSGKIQCIVSASDPGLQYILPGSSQKPGLGDYADGTDTLRFLLEEI